MFHGDNHAARAGDQVHSAAHALDHFSRDHPIGEIALFVDLHGAEHAEVDVAAADHGERISAGKISGPGEFTHSFFSGVDEVRIFLPFDWIGPDAEHAVFALQNHVHARRHVVSHQRRHSNAQVDVETVAQFAGDAFDDALAPVDIFAGFGRGRHSLQALFLVVLFSILFSNTSPLKIRFT